MFCIHCGKTIADDVKFCPFCGGKAEVGANVTPETDSARAVPLPEIEDDDPFWKSKTVEDDDTEGFVPDEVQSSRAQAAVRREKQRKKSNRTILIAIIIIVVVALAFVFIVAPKFLGMQLLPIDPFGFSEESAPDVGSASEREEDDDEDDNGSSKIDKVRIEITGLVLNNIPVNGLEEEGRLTVDMGTEIELKAVVSAKGDVDVDYDWSISGDRNNVDYSWSDDTASIYAFSSGEITITVEALGSTRSVSDATLHIVIVEPEILNDEFYPPRGVIFVTSEPKLGIFIRSAPVVSGAGNKLNDGNKIGWIDGGDTSVEMIATGNQTDAGQGYIWYEVEIPEWYRNTAKQTENYAGLPLIGWVRSDVVKEKWGR